MTGPIRYAVKTVDNLLGISRDFELMNMEDLSLILTLGSIKRAKKKC